VFELCVSVIYEIFYKIGKIVILLMLLISFLSCEKEEETTTVENDDVTWIITVSAYSLSYGVYTSWKKSCFLIQK